MLEESAVYEQQGFGADLGLRSPLGLLIVDFVKGFADPQTFGGGNIACAIENTVELLALARSKGWPIAHSRIVYGDDDSDANVFSPDGQVKFPHPWPPQIPPGRTTRL